MGNLRYPLINGALPLSGLSISDFSARNIWKRSQQWTLFYLVIFSQLVEINHRVLSQTVSMGAACVDSHPTCEFWSSVNECDNNPQWMRQNCLVSCQVCDPSIERNRVPMSVPAQVVPFGNGQPFPVQSTCGPVPQTQEIQTRFVPTGEQYRNTAFRAGCASPNQENICGRNMCFHERYRSQDGSCNNLQQSTRGAAYGAYARVLPARYEDGVNRPVGSSPGSLPVPRDVTHLLLSTKVAIPTEKNTLFMLFAQFFSHDVSRITIINTCTCSTTSSQCLNIPIPRHDTRRGECIPFTRSFALCGTGPQSRIPRTPVNENTPWIDGSQIYGSDPTTAKELRAGALLRTLPNRRLMFPPRDGNENIKVGDNRSNLFVGLACMHIIFVRLHNIIAGRLILINRHWDEDRVYQETRKILGAILQHITYEEFLPALLGQEAIKQLVTPYTGYQPQIEPQISVEFSAAVFRLHGLIREFYRLVDKRWTAVGDVRFVDVTGKVDKVLEEGTDMFIRGTFTVSAKKPHRLTTQVTEELFRLADMGTLNIQRGRDEGLASYNEYRKLCKLPGLTTFANWPEVPNPEVRKRVVELYGDRPEVMDLYPGGLIEEAVPGSLLGPTFTCLLAEQFRRLRDSDRFFYLNPTVFTPAQLQALRRVTMARVVCETGEDFPDVPAAAFMVDDGRSAVPCAQIPPLDLNAWREVL